MKFNPYARQTLGLPIYIVSDNQVYGGYIKGMTESQMSVETFALFETKNMQMEDYARLSVPKEMVFGSVDDAFNHIKETELELS